MPPRPQPTDLTVFAHTHTLPPITHDYIRNITGHVMSKNGSHDPGPRFPTQRRRVGKSAAAGRHTPAGGMGDGGSRLPETGVGSKRSYWQQRRAGNLLGTCSVSVKSSVSQSCPRRRSSAHERREKKVPSGKREITRGRVVCIYASGDSLESGMVGWPRNRKSKRGRRTLEKQKGFQSTLGKTAKSGPAAAGASVSICLGEKSWVLRRSFLCVCVAALVVGDARFARATCTQRHRQKPIGWGQYLMHRRTALWLAKRPFCACSFLFFRICPANGMWL